MSKFIGIFYECPDPGSLVSIAWHAISWRPDSKHVVVHHSNRLNYDHSVLDNSCWLKYDLLTCTPHGSRWDMLSCTCSALVGALPTWCGCLNEKADNSYDSHPLTIVQFYMMNLHREKGEDPFQSMPRTFILYPQKIEKAARNYANVSIFFSPARSPL